MHENIIRSSSKPFPDWMKTHQVFDKTRINKIFPKIGLPNFKTTCEIISTTDAQAAAQKLGNKIRYDLGNALSYLTSALDKERMSETKRNELCGKLQSAHH